MRVIHSITRLATGGSERRLVDIIEALPDANHLVVHGRDSTDAGLARLPEHVGVLRCAALVRDVSPADDMRAVGTVRRLLLRHHPHLIVTHQSKATIVTRAAVALLRRRPPLVHSASMASFGEGYPAIQSRAFRALERRTARYVGAYAVVGHDLSDRLAGCGVPREKLTVIRSDARVDEYLSERQRARSSARLLWPSLASDELVLLYVGALEKRKGVLHLPRIASEVAASSDRSVRLIIAGDGDLRSELVAVTARLPGVEVELLGHISEVPSLMRASDLVLLLSAAEGLPQVLVQAAACGTPFVSLATDGSSEVLGLGASGAIAGSVDDIPALALSLARRDGDRVAPERAFEEWRPAEIRARYRELLVQITERARRHDPSVR